MAAKQTVYELKIKPKLEEIRWWCREGATVKQIAAELGIGERAFYRAQAEHKELRDAVKISREHADHGIEDSLYDRARGKVYKESFEEEEEGVRGGKEYKFKKKRTVTREIPPDTNAAVFWLKNRQPKKWRDKLEVDSRQKVVILYDVKKPKKKRQDDGDNQGPSS